MYPLATLPSRGCPTRSCPHCASTDLKRNGHYTRRGDSRKIQRFLCRGCKRSFSRAGYSPWYRYRHRRLNPLIHKLLVTKGSLRGTARLLGIHHDTVSRHLQVLADIAREEIRLDLAARPLATHVQLDELITFEHSRLKQVAVTLISDADRYRMLGLCVSRIPTSGPNARKAREKYGPRPDESVANRDALLASVLPHISPEARFVTDQHSEYPPLIRKHCPAATHDTHVSRKASIAGQGEMKEGGFDPLFCLNHQLATLRSEISRLVRRSWTTTKKLARLEDHLMVFMAYYNRHRRPASALAYEAAVDGNGVSRAAASEAERP